MVLVTIVIKKISMKLKDRFAILNGIRRIPKIIGLNKNKKM